jgi:hypothetical protein
MGFFSDILDKLGIDTAANTAPVDAADLYPVSAPYSEDTQAEEFETEETDATADETSVTPVDVVAIMEGLADSNPQKLNWQTSIVDLLKLLDLDSSLAARKELANELGCPDNLMADSAHMNMWLHKEVLARIAANGGNIPDDMLN